MQDKTLTKAKVVLEEAWPQPFKRSPVEDGRNVVMLPLMLGVRFIKGIDAEANRATDDLTSLRDMLESEED